MRSIICIILIILINPCSAHTLKWTKLAPGLEYTQMPLKTTATQGSLHAFRINLRQYKLDFIFAKDLQKSSATISTLAKNTNAIIAINGGFFDPEQKPLGLRVQNGHIKNTMKNTSWWGIFYTQGYHANITSQQAYRDNAQIDFAIQAGPRLVINGRIPNLKAGLHERSALGITRHGKIIIAATENAPISTTQLATIFDKSEKHGGLNCANALNLDGGSSTQLYSTLNDFFLHIPNYRTITDAIVVTPRKHHS